MAKPSYDTHPKIMSSLFGKNLSIFRALLLTIPSSICLRSMEGIMKSGFWATYYSNDLKYLGIAIIIAFILGIFIYAIIYSFTQLFLGKWLPYFNALWEGLLAMMILSFTIIFGLIGIILVFTYWFTNCENSLLCIFEQLPSVIFVKQRDKVLLVLRIMDILTFIFIYIIYEIEFHIRKYISPEWIILGFLVSSVVSITGLYDKFLTYSSQNTTTNNVSEYSQNNSNQETDDTNLETQVQIQTTSDDFRDAINQGSKASNLAQKAQTEAEWNQVAEEWQKAIELMEEISASDSNYDIAQDRIAQYQKNLDYAQQISADKVQKQEAISSYDQFFRQGVEEATSASFFVQTAKTKDEWSYITTLWNNAITNMKALPANHPKYKIAQEKIVEYQKNLDYAKSKSK